MNLSARLRVLQRPAAARVTTAIAAGLNQRIPEGCFAERSVETGPIASLDSGWVAPAPVRTVPLALLTDVVEVQVFTKEGGPMLVGAVELVSPAHKDRAAHRDAFVSRCAAYLQQGVGLAIVDVVTERHSGGFLECGGFFLAGTPEYYAFRVRRRGARLGSRL